MAVSYPGATPRNIGGIHSPGLATPPGPNRLQAFSMSHHHEQTLLGTGATGCLLRTPHGGDPHRYTPLMRVVVYGATGRSGRLLVAGALDKGYEVTAFAREREPAEALLGAPERLRIVTGDLLQQRSVSEALVGADAVLFAAGPRSLRGRSQIASRGMVNVVHAMRRRGLRRLICISAAGTSLERDPHAPWVLDRLIKPLFLREALADLRHMEVTVRQSGLDWTIVRAPRLTDRAATGRYRVGPGYTLPGGTSVARTDVADFMLTQLESDEYRGHAVAIASRGRG